MPLITALDLRILHFLNLFARHSAAFDSVFVLLAGNALLEGGFIVALFWCLWLGGAGGEEDQKVNRERLLFSLVLSTFAVFVARALALALPFRLRPLHNPALHFQIPYNLDPSVLIGWSSFPSDHAVLFFCLATCMFLVSRRVGLLALAYATFVVSLPRVYLGIHYPSDVVAGALLGSAIALLSEVEPLRRKVVRPIVYWKDHYPAPFSAMLFIFCFEIAEEFSSVRDIALSGYRHFALLLQTLR